MYDVKLIEAIDRIIAKTPEKLSKNAELIDVLMQCKAALTAPQEMTAREYIIIEQRCKSWCVSNGGCESCCYRGFCWVDAIEPDAYLWFYTLWAKEHLENGEE